MKLNLGCGVHKLEGYINIDKDPKVNPDIVRDIEKGLPFSDNTVEEVYASHFLEHVEDLIFVMEEIYRVCKNGALVKIRVPHGLSGSGMRDPTHVRFFVEESFHYFDRSSGLFLYDFKCNFKIEKCKRIGDELIFELRAVKQEK